MNKNYDKYIVIFQIGPVQEFISEARKTADYWAGSYLLSYLMSKAIQEASNKGIAIIYPTISSGTGASIPNLNADSPNIPNRFVGTYNGNDVESKCKDIEEMVKKEINSISDKILSYLINTSESKDFYIKQIQDSFEIYWIVKPVEDKTFGEEYKEAEAIFEGRKAIRNFQQMNGEEGFKCTICGKRIPVLADTDDAKDRGKIKEYWSGLRGKYNYTIREDEALCGVCSIKRFLFLYDNNLKQTYPSTASVSQAHFLEKLLSNAKPDTFHEFIDSIKQLPTDYQPQGSQVPRIENNFKDKLPEIIEYDASIFYEDQYIKLEREQSNKIRAFLNEFCEIAKAKPSKYFAIIQFDGDNIGRHLRNLDEGGLKNFSTKIFTFSQTIKDKGEKDFNIKVVYAGGDEGVIFLPLFNLFEIIKFIHKTFKEQVDNNLTISVGVSISHWSDPLIDAIKASRQSLELVAKDKGKNRCGITIIKRSGDRLSTLLEFAQVDKQFALIDKLIELYSKNQICSKWYMDLLTRKTSFLNYNNNETEIDREILIAESKRLFLRKLSNEVDKSARDEALKLLIETIAILGDSEECLNYFFDMLQIVEFISKER